METSPTALPQPKVPSEGEAPEQYDGGWESAIHKWRCKCGHILSDHRALSGCGECECRRNRGSLTIEANKSFDEGKKGPWFKFESYDQAERVLRYLPTVHGHPDVIAFVTKLREDIDRFHSDNEGRI